MACLRISDKDKVGERSTLTGKNCRVIADVLYLSGLLLAVQRVCDAYGRGEGKVNVVPVFQRRNRATKRGVKWDLDSHACRLAVYESRSRHFSF